jgi:DNA repair photolyase
MDLTNIPLRKMILKEKYGEKLPEKSIMKASSDHHAKRRPRPCGLTIHPAIGCVNQCIYCYIQDMGYNFNNITPYGLSGAEMVYALLSNPYFMPTINGTYIAIGSVTEPFHEKVRSKTMEYIKAFEELGNPVQFSTKEYIDEELAKKIAQIKIPISPLITIVTLKSKNVLEPKAPDIELRIKTIRNLRAEGLKPMVFIRPIIPGITDNEAEEIIDEAKRAGAVGIVAGSLRLTRSIMERMSKLGLNVKFIREAVEGEGAWKAKRRIMEIAEERGLKAFPSSCCANAYVSGTTCINLCKNAIREVPKANVEDVRNLVKNIVGKRVRDVIFNDNSIRILMEEKLTRREKDILKYDLRVILRRIISIV